MHARFCNEYLLRNITPADGMGELKWIKCHLNVKNVEKKNVRSLLFSRLLPSLFVCLKYFKLTKAGCSIIIQSLHTFLLKFHHENWIFLLLINLILFEYFNLILFEYFTNWKRKKEEEFSQNCNAYVNLILADIARWIMICYWFEVSFFGHYIFNWHDEVSYSFYVSNFQQWILLFLKLDHKIESDNPVCQHSW